MVGKIFGGGDTKVTQTAKQNTTVNAQVDVENTVQVSTEEIAAVLQQFGLKVTEVSAETKALIQAMAQQNAIDFIGELQFNELIRQRSKQVGILIGLFGLWFFFLRKGKK